MRIGFLHLAQGGVRRYGELLAREAARRVDVTPVQASPEGLVAGSALRRAAAAFADVDVTHVQWKPNDWGRGSRALRNLLRFTGALHTPLVVTLHDVYPRLTLRARYLDPDGYALRWLSRRADRLVVHSAEEARRLSSLVDEHKIVVVPHFVEERGPLPAADAARRELGLAGCRVLTFLGHLSPRKGASLLVEALPSLPRDVVVLLAGGPLRRRQSVGDELLARASDLGVRDRVLLTGRMTEQELERALAATHLAVCPFEDMSASGSLSTWISVARPTLASDLPAIREYNDVVPGSIHTFAPRAPDALAAAARDLLERGIPYEDPRLVLLRSYLVMPRAFDRYLHAYRGAAADRHRHREAAGAVGADAA